MAQFLCIGLSPVIQRTVSFKRLQKNCVNRSEEYRMDASGKAVNSARVLNQLEKGSVRIVCPLGKDNLLTFNKLAARDGLVVNCVETPGRTRECWTLLDNSDNGTTELVVSEPSGVYDYKDCERNLLKIAEDEINQAEAVLIAGSCPSFWNSGIIPCIAKMVKQAGKVLLCDYFGENLIQTIALCTPDIIKINEEEFCATFDLPSYIPDEQLQKFITQKSIELNNIIIVTRGKKSTFAADKGEFVEFPCENVKPVNTTACGDSFSAGFLYELLNTGDFSEALAKGTWCAARNAESQVPGSIQLI